MDHLRRSLLNPLTAQPLNRASHQRENSAWVDDLLHAESSYYYLLHAQQFLTAAGKPLLLRASELAAADCLIQERLFLGLQQEKNLFVATLSQHNETGWQGIALRDLAGTVDTDTASILAYAQHLQHWHYETRYCHVCGHPLLSIQGGHVKKCCHHTCKQLIFPRLNPAVIMRITCDDHILLARQASWHENRYSVLAGFVEVGETLESAVIRETYEEAGVRVHTVNYHSSQPWPFPNSLMLGFTAEADCLHLDLSQDELEQAIWLDRPTLQQHIASKQVILPPNISISRRLIEDWMDEVS